MYRVVILEPTFEVCGGNYRTDDEPAQKYAAFPTAIMITKRNPTDFRKVKAKHKSFFKQLGLCPSDYCVADYGYNFATLGEASQKLLYEARGRGYFIKTQHGYVQCV